MYVFHLNSTDTYIMISQPNIPSCESAKLEKPCFRCRQQRQTVLLSHMCVCISSARWEWEAMRDHHVLYQQRCWPRTTDVSAGTGGCEDPDAEMAPADPCCDPTEDDSMRWSHTRCFRRELLNPPIDSGSRNCSLHHLAEVIPEPSASGGSVEQMANSAATSNPIF